MKNVGKRSISMFTGLIEKIGIIRNIQKSSLGVSLSLETDLLEVTIGDSISVNGCCLTIVLISQIHDNIQLLTVDVVEETLKCTNLGSLAPGDSVNLESSLRINAHLGGHLVQGHIDGVGNIVAKNPLSDGSWLVTVSAPPALMRYFIEKGSVALDGVSLTIFDIKKDRFSFAMIPHTAKMTILSSKNIGSRVNIEVDLIAKYVEKLTNSIQGKAI
jgi:riboflavin synthase